MAADSARIQRTAILKPMNQPPFAAAERAPDAQSPMQGYLLAVLALVASLALVWMYWRNAQQRESSAAREEFVAEAVEITGPLAAIASPATGWCRAGLFRCSRRSRNPAPSSGTTMSRAFEIEQQFPSLVGLGFAAYLNRMQLQDLQLAVRDSGRGFFTVHPPGVRERYGPVTYLEPRTPENIAAIGYDMYAEPVRRAAMDAARDEGEARLTGVVKLVQDAGSARPGLLMYSPVYRNAVVPATKRARRDALQGWVYVPFRVEKFVQISLGADSDRSACASSTSRKASRCCTRTCRLPRPMRPDDMFTHSELLDAVRSSMADRFPGRSRAQSWLRRTSGLRTTLVIGIVASLLLFGIALALARTESQAQAIAARMSESYRRSELRFRSAMEYSAIGKALLDHAGGIVDVNPALVEILGDTRERLLGIGFRRAFRRWRRPRRGQRKALTDGVLPHHAPAAVAGRRATPCAADLRAGARRDRPGHRPPGAGGGHHRALARGRQDPCAQPLAGSARRVAHARTDAGQPGAGIVRLQRLARPARAAACHRRIQPPAGRSLRRQHRRRRTRLPGAYPQCRRAYGRADRIIAEDVTAVARRIEPRAAGPEPACRARSWPICATCSRRAWSMS